ncbi:MAG TPA: hypothetical protein VGK73_20660 [Polyangiaceae bacterium]
MFGSRHQKLFDKAGDGGAGGGGNDPPKAFTDEQQQAIGQIVNSAVTSQLKRSLGPGIAEALKGVNWAETLKLDDVVKERLDELLPPDEADPDAGSGGGKAGGGKAATRPDPQVAALTAQVSELKTALEQQATKAKAAEESARDEKAQAALRSALAPHVRADALDIAASHLFVAQKRIAFDENGTPLFTVKRAAFAGGPEEDVQMPLADGVQHWIKSSEGKFFAPAPGGQPGGAPNGGVPRRMNLGSDGLPQYDKPATTDAEKVRRAQEQAQALAAKYPHLA